MVDLRYLALTMMGIFLALAIGLMIGSALGTPERQARVFESLRGQFELLREQNQSVQDENDAARRRLNAREEAERELLPLAVRGRLSGSTVGILACGSWNEGEFWRKLESALRTAGAEVGPVVRIPDRLRPLPEELRSRFHYAWETGPLPAEPDPFEAAGWITRALARGGTPVALRELAGAAGIEIRGDTRVPVRRMLVLVVSEEGEPSPAAVPGESAEVRILDAAVAEGVRVVVAEPETVTTSKVAPLRTRSIPTVDNIDTASGQISAILALAGRDGHFGSKPGATRAIPPLDRL